MMQEKWAFLDTGNLDAAENMALDEALLKWHSENKIPPTIRFYGWKRPSLSVGYFQDAEKTINFSGLKKHGCEFVRRLTGGSAVLHDDELTYSIIVSEKHPKIPKSVNQAYYILSQGLLEGYRQLGVEAEFSVRKGKRERTAVCFEKPAIYEIVVGGKKLSGNAQTRKDGVLLQHGSIPMTFNTEMLFDLFKFSSERLRERQRRSFEKKAIAINSITKKIHTYDSLKKAFLAGFQNKLNITLEPMSLSVDQMEFIQSLAEKKYRNNYWNLNKNKRGSVASDQASRILTKT